MVLKNPQSYVTLCTLIGTINKTDELKGYAALILRKKLTKRNAWMNISQEVRQQYDMFFFISNYYYLGYKSSEPKCIKKKMITENLGFFYQSYITAKFINFTIISIIILNSFYFFF